MEKITSRKNRIITHLRALGSDGDYRRSQGEYLCAGEKLLHEALACNAAISCVLWAGEPAVALPDIAGQYSAPPELVEYVSPLKNSPGPVFSVKMQERGPVKTDRAIVLESVQDPGNVGTVIRTANAFGMDAVILTGACADLYNPKTVRAAMGALFRQRVLELELDAVSGFMKENKLKLYGAALSPRAADIREVKLQNAAVAIGSEGRGLSSELLKICDGEIIIPMDPSCESLNAAVAAAVIMWESAR